MGKKMKSLAELNSGVDRLNSWIASSFVYMGPAVFREVMTETLANSLH